MARSRKNRVSDEERDADKEILQEAKDRFKCCQDWESNFRRLYWNDVKFSLGDSDNGWQWPDDLRRDREVNKRPALTINKVRKHADLIINDARQNKASISIRPTGEESSFKSAQIYEGVIRDIEYKSKAQNIYDDAMESQVEGGIGWWRVNTIYTSEDSFDQEIRIEPVRDHLSVYMDCDIKQKDGSDARYGYVFDDMPRKEFEKLYPDIDLQNVDSTGLDETDDWVRDDSVRMAEYYRILEDQDVLYWVLDQSGTASTFLKSEAPKGFEKTLDEAKEWKKRKVTVKKLEWYKIAGHQIIDRRELKGKYIPLVRVVGIERIVEGQLERKGFVRAMKDAQRMYNYQSSSQVEAVATQTKTPWVGAAEAFEGNEVAWNNANRSNAAYITFKIRDSEGNPLPPQALPQRLNPPQSSQGYLDGMRIADAELQSISGQENAQLGKEGNEKSGKAIGERQRQADTATALWPNNLAIAIRHTGVIILDMFPHYYDTKRVIQILGKDGTQSKVTINPEMEEAVREEQEREVVNVLFNPAVGKYEVQSDIGPSYGTQRQEAWNAFVQIVTSAPAMLDEIGDLMFLSADFPLADKIAERLRRKIEANAPYLLQDGGTTPQLAQMQQALKQAQGQVGDLLLKLAEKNLELKDRGEDRSIRAYEADSKRLTAETNSVVDLNKMGMELKELQQTIMQTLEQMQARTLENIPSEQNETEDVGGAPASFNPTIPMDANAGAAAAAEVTQ